MLNSIKAELYKLPKNKIFYVCTGLVILAAIWVIYKDMISSGTLMECSEWIKNTMVISALFMPVMSGFFISFSMQKEYSDGTIINVLTASPSRNTFIFSKLTIWFAWYLILLGVSLCIYAIGGKMLYSDAFGHTEIIMLFNVVFVAQLLSFIAFLPVMLVTFLQRQTFYPSLMFCLAFTAIETFAIVAPINVSCCIPWMAPLIIGLGIKGSYLITALISVFVAGIVGIGGSCFTFGKQNQ